MAMLLGSGCFHHFPPEVTPALDAGADTIASPDQAPVDAAPAPAPFALCQMLAFGRISAVKVSPDGTLVAVAGETGSVQLLDARDGTLLRVLTGHTDAVNGLAFSPDGSALASASADRSARLWRTSDGAFQRVLADPSYSDSVAAVEFSPDGASVATASGGVVKLWRASDATLLRVLSRAGIVGALSFSPDGARLAGGGSDGTIRIWASDGIGSPQTLLAGSPVRGLAFADAAGATLASAADDGSVRLWSLATSMSVRSFEGGAALSALAISRDGSLLAAANARGELHVWRSDGTAVKTLPAHAGVVGGVSFTPDGRGLASGGHDGAVALWRLEDGARLFLRAGHALGITALAFSPDGATLASAGDKTIRTWSVAGGAWKGLYADTSYVTAVAFSSDGATLASANEEKTVRLWSAADGHPLGQLPGQATVAFSGDAALLASATDRDVTVWRTSDQSMVAALSGHTDAVTAVVFGADVLASGGWDRTVKLWATGDRLLVRSLDATASVHALAFSTKAQALAAGLYDGRTALWDLAKEPPAARFLSGHAEKVAAVAFSPDGEWLATGSHDFTVKLWRRRGGELAATLTEPTRKVTAVAFSPDGQTLATGSDDGGLRLYCRRD